MPMLCAFPWRTHPTCRRRVCACMRTPTSLAPWFRSIYSRICSRRYACFLAPSSAWRPRCDKRRLAALFKKPPTLIVVSSRTDRELTKGQGAFLPFIEQSYEIISVEAYGGPGDSLAAPLMR
jgi:hypothetical protein